MFPLMMTAKKYIPLDMLPLRSLLVALLLVAGLLSGFAQGRPRKFDPKRFDAEMQQFITVEAGLTPKEAAEFFPLFMEMQARQRTLFDEMQQFRHIDTSDDRASLRAIKKMDEIDLEIKELQRQYHLKLCKVLPAGKVLRALKADEKFHRQVFRRMAHRVTP